MRTYRTLDFHADLAKVFQQIYSYVLIIFPRKVEIDPSGCADD